jgi:outer membrane translocation and assembly module TamA
MAMASAEYTIPIFKILRLAAFYDIGGVWNDAFDADFSRLASAVGAGIRFDFPGFPIRIDYATPLKHDDDYTRSERFILWIGFE